LKNKIQDLLKQQKSLSKKQKLYCKCDIYCFVARRCLMYDG